MPQEAVSPKELVAVTEALRALVYAIAGIIPVAINGSDEEKEAALDQADKIDAQLDDLIGRLNDRAGS